MQTGVCGALLEVNRHPILGPPVAYTILLIMILQVSSTSVQEVDPHSNIPQAPTRILSRAARHLSLVYAALVA